MGFRSWRELVREPGSERHLVQLYREPSFLANAVAGWALPALERGGCAILIGVPANTALVFARLQEEGIDVDAVREEGRLVVVDASWLLAQFMAGRSPDAERFKAHVVAILDAAREARRVPDAEIRAWGEMVNLLWQNGNAPAAQALETMWNEVIDAQPGLRLLCSYALDNLDPGTHAGALHDVCAGHSQLIPEEDEARFEIALGDALVDVFGEQEAGIVRTLFARQRRMPITMPPAEAVLVALHETQPEVAKRVLSSTKANLEGAS